MLEMETAPTARTSFATVLALVGTLAILAGWFLPWMSMTDRVAESMKFTQSDLEALDKNATAQGMDESSREALKHLVSRQAINGRDWAGIANFILESDTQRPTDPVGVRGLRLAVTVLRWTPWAVGAIALFLLLGMLRKPSFPVVALVLTVGFLLASAAGLICLGASENAKKSGGEEAAVLGMGIYAIIVGGSLATLGGLFAVKSSTWWKAYLLTIILVVGVIWGSIAYVQGA
jgi:hypothetical protein